MSISKQIVLAFLPVLISLLAFYKNQYKFALFFLFVGAFCIRYILCRVDPLHNWDEHFHALVAKNMTSHPFKPMLYIKTYLPFDYGNWTANHVWLHKQPLFLWLMALSIKLFGTNVLAVRMPSILMGSLSVLMVYQIVAIWLTDKRVAYVAALLMACNYFQIELTTGKFATDHNDVAFTFFVTASIWAFIKFVAKSNWLNAILIGLFAGCAVLVKWLPGLLIFGVWLVYGLLKDNGQFFRKHFKYFFVALVVSLVVFIPWQIYILNTYPIEAQSAYDFNRKHIFTTLDGMEGSLFYHLLQWETLYGLLWILIPVGFWVLFKKHRNVLSVSMMVGTGVLYLFFTMVSTKMPGYTFPVSSMFFAVMALAWVSLSNKVSKNKAFFSLSLLIVSIVSLNPLRVLKHRADDNIDRIKQLQVQQQFQLIHTKADVVFNLSEYEYIDWMFYQKSIAYGGLPTQHLLDSLLNAQVQVAVLVYDNNLPDFISENPQIELIE